MDRQHAETTNEPLSTREEAVARRAISHASKYAAYAVNLVSRATSIRSRQYRAALPSAPAYCDPVFSFVQLCTRHGDWLQQSVCIDNLLLAVSCIYLERAGLLGPGQIEDAYLFFALFLAMEMEEDATDGLTDVVLYVLGERPDPLVLPCSIYNQRVCVWNEGLRAFYKGKDRFWTRLGYRGHVSPSECQIVASGLALRHPLLGRTRSAKDLLSFRLY